MQAVVTLPAMVPPAPGQEIVGPAADYMRRLGLGKKMTLLFVFNSEDKESRSQIGFYKRLSALPQFDKINGRLIVLTVQGVVPAMDMLKEAGVTLHAGGSFPEEHGGLPVKMGSVAILDGGGKIVRSWFGFPSSAQQDEIVKFVEEMK